MKPFQLFILLFILISCKKENIYYYSDNTPIKDSTVIRFVDEELEKLKINIDAKNLKIYTTLDSTSYRFDTIRNQIFNKAVERDILKLENQKAFEDWYREKAIIVDNETGKVINFYSSFKNKKYDRNLVNMGSLRKLVRLEGILNKNDSIEIPENYLSFYEQVYNTQTFIIEPSDINFLGQINIKNINKGLFTQSYISYLNTIKIFQSCNENLVKEPIVVEKIIRKKETIYVQKEQAYKIFSNQALNKIQQHLKLYKENKYRYFDDNLNGTENLFTFGTYSDHYLIFNDKKHTYFIYFSGAIATDLSKRKLKMIPLEWKGKIGIKYYNAIRK